MEDAIVTLLDGTKIPKSKVPVGVIYINEKGQKVKKVVKAAPAKAPAQTSKIGEMFSDMSKVGANVVNSVSATASNIGKSISNATKNVGDSVSDFAWSTIMKLLKGVDIQSLVNAVKKYGSSSGKDVSATINFLNKLINLQKNGK